MGDVTATPAHSSERTRMNATNQPALSTENLSKHWGAFRANDKVTLQVQAGARHALIGPNGAGKTTLVNLLTGYLRPTKGEVYLAAQRLTGSSQHARVKRGLTRTFQINNLFSGLSVLESVVVACLESSGRATHWFRTLRSCRTERDDAWLILEQLGLCAQAETKTRELSYGKQRLLEIALALATKPQVLLLDEPASGIPAEESSEVFEVLTSLPRDVTLLFIEHDMNLVFQFAEHVSVLVAGKILLEGKPEKIAEDPEVRALYLGETA